MVIPRIAFVFVIFVGVLIFGIKKMYKISISLRSVDLVRVLLLSVHLCEHLERERERERSFCTG